MDNSNEIKSFYEISYAQLDTACLFKYVYFCITFPMFMPINYCLTYFFIVSSYTYASKNTKINGICKQACSSLLILHQRPNYGNYVRIYHLVPDADLFTALPRR